VGEDGPVVLMEDKELPDGAYMEELYLTKENQNAEAMGVT